MFFHCSVQVCNVTDTNSRCARGCQSRSRRSLKPLPESTDGVYSLAQGPLTLNREKREAEVNDAVDSDQSMRVAKKGKCYDVILIDVIGLKIKHSCHLISQSDVSPKVIVTKSRAFSRSWRQIYLCICFGFLCFHQHYKNCLLA